MKICECGAEMKLKDCKNKQGEPFQVWECTSKTHRNPKNTKYPFSCPVDKEEPPQTAVFTKAKGILSPDSKCVIGDISSSVGSNADLSDAIDTVLAHLKIILLNQQPF